MFDPADRIGGSGDGKVDLGGRGVDVNGRSMVQSPPVPISMVLGADMVADHAPRTAVGLVARFARAVLVSLLWVAQLFLVSVMPSVLGVVGEA